MLKQRIATACVLAVLVSSVLLFGNRFWFATFISIVVALAAWEWASLSAQVKRWPRALYAAAVLSCVAVLAWLFRWLALRDALFAVACAGWLLCFFCIKSYPASAPFWRAPWLRLAMGGLVLVPAWHAFVYLRSLEHGQWLVATLIATVAAADIGAYFTGKNFGRRKLAPRVSPGKTWEGVVGGATAATIFLGFVMVVTINRPLYWALLLAVPVVLVSVLGDLFESMLKRECGVKDSGTLLPGHGGVLDRIDGLLAAAPVFALIIVLAGWAA